MFRSLLFGTVVMSAFGNIAMQRKRLKRLLDWHRCYVGRRIQKRGWDRERPAEQPNMTPKLFCRILIGTVDMLTFGLYEAVLVIAWT